MDYITLVINNLKWIILATICILIIVGVITLGKHIASLPPPEIVEGKIIGTFNQDDGDTYCIIEYNGKRYESDYLCKYLVGDMVEGTVSGKYFDIIGRIIND